MKTTKSKGFTLIELLVVIAIIGILSSVVLASLNTARGKGADAAAKENLNNIRAQAELSYDSNGQTYVNVCTDTNVKAGVAAASSAEGGSWLTTANNSATVGCYSLAGSWIAYVTLAKGSTPTAIWCTDNTGQAKVEAAASITANSTTACP